MTVLASPRSLDEALEALERNPDLTLIAGCTDLMVANGGWRTAFTGVLDVTGIPELHGIREDAGWIEIGAATTFSELGQSELVARELPALAAAARVIGGWQIQNRATIGGNIVNASPAGDSLPVLQALDAEVVVAGAHGERRIPFTSFYRGYRETVLERGELLARVLLPLPAARERQFFRKVGTRQAQAISKVVVALAGRLEDGTVVDYRLAAGSVAPTPVRLGAVEREVVGRSAAGRLADLAGKLAATSVEPIDDVRSTAAYRRYALEKVVRRLTLKLFDDEA